MKKLLILTLAGMLAFGAPTMEVHATSLDDVVSQSQTGGESETPTETQPVVTDPVVTDPVVQEPVVQEPVVTEPDNSTSNREAAEKFMAEVQSATNLSEPSVGASKVNEGIKKIASFIIQILSYFITIGMVVKIVIDLCYICIPFTRSFLANGYGGNPQAGGGGMQGGMMGGGMMGSPMGGGMMGSPMGGMMGGGMMGGGMYGRGRYGMGGGMMGSPMGGGMMGQQGMPGATPAMGRIQLVSTAALNAASAETVVGPDGKAVSPLKQYCKDMIPMLVLTPILLTLAITGVLTDLGFLLGGMLADAIANIGNMI
ncbi:MAG: hypothetical protein J6A59_07535 [Lachnospiraceae bacterium]|nr:hypothetical protein [Lachnospiraceae bacterium]